MQVVSTKVHFSVMSKPWLVLMIHSFIWSSTLSAFASRYLIFFRIDGVADDHNDEMQATATAAACGPEILGLPKAWDTWITKGMRDWVK